MQLSDLLATGKIHNTPRNWDTYQSWSCFLPEKSTAEFKLQQLVQITVLGMEKVWQDKKIILSSNWAQIMNYLSNSFYVDISRQLFPSYFGQQKTLKPSNFPEDHKAAYCQTLNWKHYLVWFCWPAPDPISWFWTTSEEPLSSKILLIPIITLLHLTEFLCFHLCFQKQKMPALLFWRMLHILRWK